MWDGGLLLDCCGVVGILKVGVFGEVEYMIWRCWIGINMLKIVFEI